MNARRTSAPVSPERRFLQLFNRLVAERHKWEVFSDFCELAALALSNSLQMDAARESRYLAIINRYTDAEDQQVFPEMLACVVRALEDAGGGDFLGPLFMSLDLSNHWKGQFFTPYALCSGMARMTCDPAVLKGEIEAKGYVTVLEPACGSGAMAIAFAECVREYGYEPSEHLHVTAVDADATAAHMCYIQLSLLGIPASVHVGNSLTGEVRESFHTPAHYLGLWSARVDLRRDGYSPAETPSPDAAADPVAVSDHASSAPAGPVPEPPTPRVGVRTAVPNRESQMDLFGAER